MTSSVSISSATSRRSQALVRLFSVAPLVRKAGKKDRAPVRRQDVKSIHRVSDPQERKRRIWPNPAQSSPLPRHLVVEFAAERGVRHCRVCLGCFAGAFKGGRLDPADPRVSMLEAADAKLDDGIVVRLYPLHSSAV